MRKTCFLLLFLIPLMGCLQAQTASGTDSLRTHPHLVVGIKESPPFVFFDKNGNPTGLSVQLWELIAAKLLITYEYKIMSLEELLFSVEQDSVDLSINPLTVTAERIQVMDFTQPFHVGNSAVAVKDNEVQDLFSVIRGFFSWNFLKAILALFGVLFVFGFLVWIFERKKNPEEFPEGWNGIWHGIWWSAVTMTTVGYGDKSPRSGGGRIIGLIWMFTAIIIISGFTASIASALTVNQLDVGLNDLSELRKRRVGSVSASASANYLKHNLIKVEPFVDCQPGLLSLQADEIDAFVFDEPILKDQILRDSLDNIEVLPLKFNPQYYAFALPLNSPWVNKINPVLLDEIEDRNWKIILSQYGLGEF